MRILLPVLLSILAGPDLPLTGEIIEWYTEEEEAPPELPRKWFVDANVGYFYPFSKNLRSSIPGGVDYQLSISYQPFNHFGAFLSGDFFIRDGTSTSSHSKTSLWILPISLGLRGTIDLWEREDQKLIVYSILGPRWYLVSATNHYRYVDAHNFCQQIGGVGGLGLAYLYKHLTVNIILDGSYGKVQTTTKIPNVKTPSTQVGGLVAGGGLGLNF